MLAQADQAAASLPPRAGATRPALHAVPAADDAVPTRVPEGAAHLDLLLSEARAACECDRLDIAVTALAHAVYVAVSKPGEMSEAAAYWKVREVTAFGSIS
jgi:hypothetical protein